MTSCLTSKEFDLVPVPKHWPIAPSDEICALVERPVDGSAVQYIICTSLATYLLGDWPTIDDSFTLTVDVYRPEDSPEELADNQFILMFSSAHDNADVVRLVYWSVHYGKLRHDWEPVLYNRADEALCEMMRPLPLGVYAAIGTLDYKEGGKA